MTKYLIRYEAENVYQHVVNEALFELLVLPVESSIQTLADVKIENSLSVPVFSSRNTFGAKILCFRIAQPFNQLRFSVACTVRKSTQRGLPDENQCLPRDEEQRLLQSTDFTVNHYLYIRPTPLTDLSEDSVPTALCYRYDRSLLSYAKLLNEAVYGMMRYQPWVTTIETSARDVLHNPQGVCQDYSHLMLGILRQQGIPSRYVSGYLNQGQDFMGSAQLHAWVEVLIPKLGWVGFDPTNNRLTDHHHIKVADGLDYTDCSPLKGYINPGVANTTVHTVQVVEQ